MTIPSNCPLIEISGPARERGRQYGEQAKDRIKRGVDHYATQIHASNVDWQQIREITARFEPSIAACDPDYVEEMRGIAEGAGVEYAAIVLLNARTEMLKLAKRRQRGEDTPDDPDGCPGLVALPAATKAGRLIHAQNWDRKIECAETAVVLRIRRENQPDILTFTEAGVLARFGFNSAGIAITGNYLGCERDYRRLGVPLALIRRKVLEQRRLALAMHSVYTTPKSASNNIIVSHANGIAIDFECVPDETFQVQPEKGLVTPETVKAALFEDFETPWSVCRPPRENLSNNQSATVAMIVMEPAAGTIEVALLPALNRQFASYSLGMRIEVPSTAVTRPKEAARTAA